MPHARTSSVASSIHSLFRRGSLLGSKSKSKTHLNDGASHGQHPHNASSTPGMSSVLALPGLGANQHVHMLPEIPASVRPDASIVEWMSRVQETRLEVVIATSPKYFTVNEARMAEIEPGSVQMNPTASLLFLRILNTKLYGSNDKSYQLHVRVGDSLQGVSCVSSKAGDLVDWFLIDLNQGIEADNCWIEISLQHGVHANKHKSIRKILGLGMSGSKSQTASAADLSLASSPTRTEASLRIPLYSVVFSSDDRFPKPWGTYYLCDPHNNKILGEITLDISESPESFSVAPLVGKAKTESKFTGPLTVLRNEGRVAHWQRITGVICNRELVAYDFQRNTGSSLWLRSLKQVTALEFTKKHPMSIDNVIELTFSNDEKLFAYADDAKMGLKWADKLSMAIWGQPYTMEESY